jgi:hypothetical protein
MLNGMEEFADVSGRSTDGTQFEPGSSHLILKWSALPPIAYGKKTRRWNSKRNWTPFKINQIQLKAIRLKAGGFNLMVWNE